MEGRFSCPPFFCVGQLDPLFEREPLGAHKKASLLKREVARSAGEIGLNPSETPRPRKSRWPISEQDRLLLRRKLKTQAAARLQRELSMSAKSLANPARGAILKAENKSAEGGIPMAQLQQFPRTQVDGLSLSRMVIGTNWMLGFSHRSPAADTLIEERNGNGEACAAILEAFLSRGVDTLIGPLGGCDALWEGMHIAEERTGRKIYKIDTASLDVNDTKEGRAAAKARIQKARDMGVDILMFGYASVEQLVNKRTQTIERIGDYTDMIREAGMIPGTSGHMPEVLQYCDLNDYDIQCYVQVYNCMGFMMQYEIETIYKNIQNAKKPVLTIKPLAAGRVSPFVGFTFSWNTLRPQDMVAVGCVSPAEALEDVEYSLAVMEHRPPNIRGGLSEARAKILELPEETLAQLRRVEH